MNEIMKALASGESAETAVAKETLRYMVSRVITCPQTGFVLDVRRAVLFEIVGELGTTQPAVVDAEAWDGVYGEQVRNAVASKTNLRFGEVLDGRVLYGGKVAPESTARAIRLGRPPATSRGGCSADHVVVDEVAQVQDAEEKRRG